MHKHPGKKLLANIISRIFFFQIFLLIEKVQFCGNMAMTHSFTVNQIIIIGDFTCRHLKYVSKIVDLHRERGIVGRKEHMI